MVGLSYLCEVYSTGSGLEAQETQTNKQMAQPELYGTVSVDVPGDLLYVQCILSGQKQPPECAEYDSVKKLVDEHGVIRIICPPGCVKTKEDVNKKCGIIY